MNIKMKLKFYIILVIFALNISVAQDKVVLVVQRSVHFSSVSNMDTFELVARGNDTLNSIVTFSIRTIEGDTIFSETFPATDLIGYNLLETEQLKITDVMRLKVILKRFETFFDSTNFYQPAIKHSDVCDSSYSDVSVWNDIKSDQTAIGFHFLIGEENGRSIAYSKAKRKVVVYFSCC